MDIHIKRKARKTPHRNRLDAIIRRAQFVQTMTITPVNQEEVIKGIAKATGELAKAIQRLVLEMDVEG